MVHANPSIYRIKVVGNAGSSLDKYIVTVRPTIQDSSVDGVMFRTHTTYIYTRLTITRGHSVETAVFREALGVQANEKLAMERVEIPVYATSIPNLIVPFVTTFGLVVKKFH